MGDAARRTTTEKPPAKTVKLGSVPLRYREVGGLTPQKIVGSLLPGQVACLTIVAAEDGEIWIRHVGAGEHERP